MDVGGAEVRPHVEARLMCLISSTLTQKKKKTLTHTHCPVHVRLVCRVHEIVDVLILGLYGYVFSH